MVVTLPVLLLCLGNTPMPLPYETADVVEVTGTSARVVFDGQGFVVVWLDDRLDALRARPMTPTTRWDVWAARVAGGTSTPPRPLCVAGGSAQLAVAADPSSGRTFAAWVDPTSTGVASINALEMGLNTAGCLGPIYPVGSPSTELQASWTGTRYFLAWNSGGALSAVWLSPDAGVLQSGPTNVSVDSYASLQVGRVGQTARAVYLANGGASHATFPEGLLTSVGSPLGSSNLAVSIDPAGNLMVAGSATQTTAYWTDGGTTNLMMGLQNGGPLALASLAGTGVLAFPVLNGTAVTSVLRQGSSGVAATLLTGEREPALASSGADALLVTSNGAGVLQFRKLTMGSGLESSNAVPVATVPLDGRRPSVVWAEAEWLIAWEEGSSAGFTPAFARLQLDGGVTAITGLALPNPVLLAQPDGKLLLRTDSDAGTTSSQLTHSNGVLLLSLPPTLSESTPRPAGGATNRGPVHWDGTRLLSTPGAEKSVSNGRLLRPSAAADDFLWIPLVTTTGLATLTVDAKDLENPGVPLPPVQPRVPASAFTATVTPAIAAKMKSGTPVALLAWATATGPAWAVVTPSATGSVQQLGSGTSPHGLAAVALNRGWCLAVTSATGLDVLWLDEDGSIALQQPINASNQERLGEPVAAGSKDDAVAVVWPSFAPAPQGSGAVQLNAVVLPFPTTSRADGGTTDDAGTADAGTDDAGTSDAGLADAGGDDAGTPADGGARVPLDFTTTGCNCAGVPGAAGSLLVLFLVAARARRRR